MLSDYETDIRATLVRQLDGRAIEGTETTRTVYRSLLASLEPRFGRTLDRLRQIGIREVALLESVADDVTSMFRFMGVDGTATDLEDSRLAVLGCTGGVPSVTASGLDDFFARRGVLVTSDRTLAALPLEVAGLRVGRPAPPRRGRVVLDERSVPGWRCVAGAGLAPAVTLDAGHIPVECARDIERPATVLAYNALDARPLIVLVPIGDGWLLHSVAHWYQYAPAGPTAVERRPADTLRRHIPELDIPPGTSLGLFLAARVMVYCLLSGLEIAFNPVASDLVSEARQG